MKRLLNILLMGLLLTSCGNFKGETGNDGRRGSSGERGYTGPSGSNGITKGVVCKSTMTQGDNDYDIVLKVFTFASEDLFVEAKVGSEIATTYIPKPIYVTSIEVPLDGDSTMFIQHAHATNDIIYTLSWTEGSEDYEMEEVKKYSNCSVTDYRR